MHVCIWSLFYFENLICHDSFIFFPFFKLCERVGEGGVANKPPNSFNYGCIPNKLYGIFNTLLCKMSMKIYQTSCQFTELNLIRCNLKN